MGDLEPECVYSLRQLWEGEVDHCKWTTCH